MKRLSISSLLIVLILKVYAQDQGKVSLSVSGGYQACDLGWSIAGNANGNLPNIYSEVKWHNLKGTSVNVALQFNLNRRWFLLGKTAKSFISGGTATDTDYGRDNRQDPTYQATLNADQGFLITSEGYTGYRFVNGDRLKLSAILGYRISREKLYLLDHANEVQGQKNLHTTYATKWHGILAGLTANYELSRKWSLTGMIKYSQLTYHATADWNLIDAFQHPDSFKQNANGYEYDGSIALSCRLSRLVTVRITITGTHAETGKGVDRLFLDSGTIVETQFNGAVRTSRSIMIGPTFNF